MLIIHDSWEIFAAFRYLIEKKIVEEEGKRERQAAAAAAAASAAQPAAASHTGKKPSSNTVKPRFKRKIRQPDFVS